jgi:hypothetical protein
MENKVAVSGTGLMSSLENIEFRPERIEDMLSSLKPNEGEVFLLDKRICNATERIRSCIRCRPVNLLAASMTDTALVVARSLLGLHRSHAFSKCDSQRTRD